jgi:MFS family permease
MHALADLHWTSDRLGTLFGVLALALIGTQAFGLPRLAQRFSDGALAAWGSAAVALAYVAVARFGVPGAFASAVLYGVGNGLMWPSYLSMLSETGPVSARGRLQGVASSAGSVASITGMLGGGGAFATFGSGTFFVAAAALGAATFVFIASPKPAA